MAGGGEAGGLVFLPQELGDAEVQEDGAPFLRHQDVGGLEIPMHHQAPVGVGDGLADLEKEEDRLPIRKAPIPAVGVDGDSLDILHDQVGRSLLRSPPVVEAGDAGMLQAGESRALPEKARPHGRRIKAPPDDLEGHLALEPLVLPLGEKDLPHAALPQATKEPIGADEAGLLCRFPRPLSRNQLRQGLFEESPGFAVRPEEHLKPPLEIRPIPAGLLQETLLLFPLEAHGLIEELVDLVLRRGKHQALRGLRQFIGLVSRARVSGILYGLQRSLTSWDSAIGNARF